MSYSVSADQRKRHLIAVPSGVVMIFLFAVIQTNTTAAQEDLKSRLAAKQDEVDDIIALMTPVLNLVDLEAGEYDRQLTRERYQTSERSVVHCRSAMERLRVYVHGVACAAAGQALAIVRSLYPGV